MAQWKVLFATASACSTLVAAVTVRILGQWLFEKVYIYALVAGAVSIVAAVFCAVCLHIVSLQPSESHTLASLLQQYLLYAILPLLGWIYSKKAERYEWIECAAAQEKKLLKILRKNANTQYGRKHRFGDIKSKSEFVVKHPLTTYEHYSKYVEEVLDGKQNVLFPDRPVHFAVSSGTTGKNKVFPIHDGIKSMGLSVGAMMYLNTTRIVGSSLKRVLGIRYKPKLKYNKDNICIAPLSYYTTFHLVHHISPYVVAQVSEEPTALYLHAVFGLAEKDLFLIDCLFSTVLLTFFKLIEQKWEEILYDIEHGTISSNITIDEPSRKKILFYLKPNPERASELRQIFMNGFNKRTIKRIWPSCQGLSMISGGGFYNSYLQLKDNFIGDLPVCSLGHGASEGLGGIVYPHSTMQFVNMVVPGYCFYEYIPVEQADKDSPKTVFLEQLEVGKSYEIVLTTDHGLYRYRLGDVIKIVDYFHKVPIYEFQYRTGQMLNVSWEKTPENVFYAAVSDTVKEWPGIRLVDYTATENINAPFLPENDLTLKHYILFMELSRETGDEEPKLTSEQRKQFDVTLCRKFELYQTLRDSGQISMMQVIQVRPGAFQKLKELLTAESKSIQFKMPRVNRKPEALTLLNSYKL